MLVHVRCFNFFYFLYANMSLSIFLFAIRLLGEDDLNCKKIETLWILNMATRGCPTNTRTSLHKNSHLKLPINLPICSLVFASL